MCSREGGRHGRILWATVEHFAQYPRSYRRPAGLPQRTRRCIRALSAKADNGHCAVSDGPLISLTFSLGTRLAARGRVNAALMTHPETVMTSDYRPTDGPSPYRQPEINFIYNLLFCDDLSLFKPEDGKPLAHWESALFAPNPDAQAIRTIAENDEEESRIRALAFNWLREHKHAVPERQLLGVVVEVPLDGGLDAIAAYADGRVRYINQTGKVAAFEGAPSKVEIKAKALVASALPTIHRIGPWGQKRLPPPTKGAVRMTFLVSDGLYFGEGHFAQMQREPMAAPVIQTARELLLLVVSAATDEIE